MVKIPPHKLQHMAAEWHRPEMVIIRLSEAVKEPLPSSGDTKKEPPPAYLCASALARACVCACAGKEQTLHGVHKNITCKLLEEVQKLIIPSFHFDS